MRWIDEGNEMKFFTKVREVRYDIPQTRYRVFILHNIRTGNIFCRLKIYEDRYEIEVNDFFEPIKNEMYDLIMRDLVEEDAYSYDKWLLPLYREMKLKEIGI